MKEVLILVLALVSATAAEGIYCVQGSDGTAAATKCGDIAATICSKPKFTEYTGFSDVTYACGACASGTKDSTCEECTGSTGDGCNKPVSIGANFKCYSNEFSDGKFVVKSDQETCKRLSATPIICNNPSSTATDTSYTNTNGCGPCAGETKGPGCTECSTDSCNKTPIKCVQGSDGSAAATNCADTAATICSKPKFTEYTGFSDVNYACGACADGTKDSTCEECAGRTDDGCNKPVSIGADFKCHTYQFDDTKKTYSQIDTTCKRLPNTDLVCNMPASKDITADKYSNKNGCGTCAGDTKKEETCKECTTGLCNKLDMSGAAMSVHIPFLLIPLQVLFYLLL